MSQGCLECPRQIMCVHPASADAPEIPHFPGTFKQTP